MKNCVSRALTFLLAIALTALSAPLKPQNVSAAPSQGVGQAGTARTKTGPETVARVKKLKEKNKSVRAALEVFEKRGHTPKIEDSWIITDKVPASDVALQRRGRAGRGATFEQVALRTQQETYSTGEGEIVFIPTINIDREWQGTIVITAYDEYGNFVNDYTADVVLRQDPETYLWDVVYEVGFEAGVPYLSWESGMYTGFALGTPLQEQATPPTTLDSWQVYNPTFDPAEGRFGGYYHEDPMPMYPVSRVGGGMFKSASFIAPQAGDRGGDYRYRQGRCPCDPPPAIRNWAKCTFVAGSGTASLCVFALTFTAPCFASRIAAAGVGCAVRGITGW